jgi:hypothetical protein
VLLATIRHYAFFGVYVNGQKSMCNKILMRIFLVFSILSATFGCSSTSDEIVLPATEVGTPIGEKVTKEIGPSGGAFASADGRLTLTVPPNAVTENVTFSIQPITNNVEDAVGPAYRIEPSGKTFNVPVNISVKYAEQDIEGTFPHFLRMAYQNEKREWNEQSSTKLDMENHTVTTSTSHLSDWSFYLGEYVRIIPAKADVKVGKTVKLTVKSCQFNYWMAWALYGRKKVCEEKVWSSETGFPFKLKGPGTLTGAFPSAIYTAPASQPKPNVVTITYYAPLFPQDISELEAKIRIIGQGYRAAGTDGGMTFSGTICSLEKPFKITGQTQLKFDFNFTPSSATAGTVAIGGGGMGITIGNGSGSYTVEGADTDHPKIALTGNFAGSYPGAGTAQGGGTKHIDLIPTDTSDADCGESPPPPPTPAPWTQDPRLRQKRGL